MRDTKQMDQVLRDTPVTKEPSDRKWSRILPPILGLGAVLGAAGFIAQVNPSGSSVYPPCPTQLLFGVDCPGCGGLRCIHELMNGDLVAAADQNLLAVLVLPLILIAFAAVIARRFMGSADEPPGLFSNTLGSLRTIGISINQRMLMLTLLIGTVVFTVVRNLSFVPFIGSGIG